MDNKQVIDTIAARLAVVHGNSVWDFLGRARNRVRLMKLATSELGGWLSGYVPPPELGDDRESRLAELTEPVRALDRNRFLADLLAFFTEPEMYRTRVRVPGPEGGFYELDSPERGTEQYSAYGIVKAAESSQDLRGFLKDAQALLEKASKFNDEEGQRRVDAYQVPPQIVAQVQQAISNARFPQPSRGKEVRLTPSIVEKLVNQAFRLLSTTADRSALVYSWEHSEVAQRLVTELLSKTVSRKFPVPVPTPKRK